MALQLAFCNPVSGRREKKLKFKRFILKILFASEGSIALEGGS